jgi:hypothetical protein
MLTHRHLTGENEKGKTYDTTSKSLLYIRVTILLRLSKSPNLQLKRGCSTHYLVGNNRTPVNFRGEINARTHQFIGTDDSIKWGLVNMTFASILIPTIISVHQ